MAKSNTSIQPPSAPEKKEHRSLGKMLTYAFTVIILVVIVVTFVGTPVLSSAAQRGRLVFGVYDGQEISYLPGNFFAREFDGIAQQVQDSEQQVTDALIREIWRAAFERTVFHTALLLHGNSAGVAVSDEAVDRSIALWPAFQEDGRFSPERYQSMSSQQRFALRDYLEETMVDQRVRSDLLSLTGYSDAELDFILQIGKQERQFNFISFSFATYPSEEVFAYGEENRERFRKIDLSVITITSNFAEAEAIQSQAVNREASFEDLARNQSRDIYAEEGGARGLVYYHELEPDFEDLDVIEEIFELEVGEVSRVFETTFGWTIYRVNDPPIEADFSDPDALADIRNYMNLFERGRIEDYMREQADVFVTSARESSFSDAASEVNQLPQQTTYFPVNYGNLPYFATVGSPSNDTLSSAAFQQDFFTELFGLADGEVTDPIVLRDYVFVFELADERTSESQTAEFWELYLPYVVQQFASEEVERVVVDDELLVDNFNAVYNRAVLGQ